MSRVRFECFICCDGTEPEFEAFGRSLLLKFSSRYGGATVYPIRGGWSMNGNAQKDLYSDVSIEPGIKVALSVSEELSDIAYEDLKHVISSAVQEHGLTTRFVHVDRFACQPLHFEVGTLEYCSESA